MGTFSTDTTRKIINTMTPGSNEVKLGDIVCSLVSEFATLQTRHNALLAHLDTANVAGIGNGNAAAFGVTVPPSS